MVENSANSGKYVELGNVFETCYACELGGDVAIQSIAVEETPVSDATLVISFRCQECGLAFETAFTLFELQKAVSLDSKARKELPF